MQIQNRLENFPLIKKIYLKVRKCVYYLFIFPYKKTGCMLRKYGLSDKYAYLRRYKNKYCNKRCFIIATGPSLTKEDYVGLSDEYTFGVNAICKWYQETGVKTDWLVVTDPKAYKTLFKFMPNSDIVFTSDIKENRIIGAEHIKHNRIPIDTSNNYRESWLPNCFSNNIEVCAYNGNSVVFIAIQIAIYMGFKEIYLVGTDCNYDINPSKWYSVDHGIMDKNNITAGERMIGDFKVALLYARKLGVDIYNATRGGMLEVFPRVSLDEFVRKDRLC